MCENRDQSALSGNSAPDGRQQPAHDLNKVGVLRRREIEARIVAPLIEALGRQFGRERVLEVAAATIIQIAREQGKELVAVLGGQALTDFAKSLEAWKKDNALQIEVLEQTDERFSFNVTRCRYAEMYRALGVPELGTILSCNRDFALIQGFNERISLRRTQTIMEGSAFCDFRYVAKE